MTATTLADAQLSMDHFWSTTGDARLRPPGRYLDPAELTEEEGRPRWPSVGELADAEELMALPAVPYPATIEVHKTVDDKASVAFRGNRYSVPPGMGGVELTLRHRLGTGSLEVFSPSGIELVSHALAQPGAGQMVRTEAHQAALEAVVLAQFSTERPCDRKANKPPGQAAQAERAVRVQRHPIPHLGSRIRCQQGQDLRGSFETPCDVSTYPTIRIPGQVGQDLRRGSWVPCDLPTHLRIPVPG